MDKLGDFINDALNNKAVSGASQSSLICFWADEWGKGRFTPISFSKGTIKVSVDSAAAAQELSMQSEKLIKYLNSKIGYQRVKELRIENHN